MAYRPSLRNGHSYQGMLSLEILTAAALMLYLFSLAGIPYTSYLHQQHLLQLQQAALELATDIRSLQQASLFSVSARNRIVILSDKEGYYILTNDGTSKRYVRFPENNCAGVYFANTNGGSISFSSSGAPATAGEYRLKHRQEPGVSYVLTLQVASGRVDVNEE